MAQFEEGVNGRGLYYPPSKSEISNSQSEIEPCAVQPCLNSHGITFLTDDTLRTQLGCNAAEDARRRFDLNRQVEAYLGWYEELMGGSEGGEVDEEEYPARTS